jgi:hypothetical protein
MGAAPRYDIPMRAIGRISDILSLAEQAGIKTTEKIIGRFAYIYLEAPMCSEWEAGPAEHPAAGLLRMIQYAGWPTNRRPFPARPDPTKPFSPENFRWAREMDGKPNRDSRDPQYRRVLIAWEELNRGAGVLPWASIDDFTRAVGLPPETAPHTRVKLVRVSPHEPISAANLRWVASEKCAEGDRPLRIKAHHAFDRLPAKEREAAGWKDFRAFLKAVGLPMYGAKRVSLVRKDPSQPHSKENSYWKESSAAPEEQHRRSRAYQTWYRLGKESDKAGNPWNDFELFLHDVGLPPTLAKRVGLSRRDSSRPHSKENTLWVDRSASTHPADGVGAVEPTPASTPVPAPTPDPPQGTRPCPCGRRQIYDPDLDLCSICVFELAKKAS